MSTVSLKGRLPEPKTVLSVLDQQGQLASRKAIKVASEELRVQAPRSNRGGQHVADQVATRVSKTKTGWKAVANWGRRKPHRGVYAAQVVRWITRGTGLYRSTPGSKHRIRAKSRLHRLNLGNGIFLWSVKGQRPNQFVDRAKDAARAAATEELRHGATEAARILREKGLTR